MNEIELLKNRIQSDIEYTQDQVNYQKNKFAADPLYALEYSCEPLAWALAELQILRKIEKIIDERASDSTLTMIDVKLETLRDEIIDDLIHHPHQHQSTSIMKNALSEWTRLAQADMLRRDGKITRLIASLQQHAA